MLCCLTTSWLLSPGGCQRERGGGVEARGLKEFAGAAQPSPAKTHFSIVYSPLKVMHHVNNLQPTYRLLPQINSCGNNKAREKKSKALVRSDGKIQRHTALLFK